MIDRLEELLAQVDEPETTESAMRLDRLQWMPALSGGTRAGNGPSAEENTEGRPGAEEGPLGLRFRETMTRPWGEQGGSPEAPTNWGTGDRAASGSEELRPPEALGSDERDTLALNELVRAGSALPGLYRQIIRASSGENGARGAAVAVVREAVAPAADGITAGELDLAMRRDSRRYDGGMTIY